MDDLHALCFFERDGLDDIHFICLASPLSVEFARPRMVDRAPGGGLGHDTVKLLGDRRARMTQEFRYQIYRVPGFDQCTHESMAEHVRVNADWYACCLA